MALSYTIEKSVPADAKFTDTVYTHPTHTAKASGLYKITVDELGHVSAASAVTGTDLPSHSHNLSIASSTGTSQISLSANAKYQLTAGGSTYIFTTPADTNTTYTVASGDSNGQIKITPSVGDAYNVSVKGLGSAAYTNSSAYATSGHTHTLNMAADTGTSQISLSANTKYKLTAGGSTYIFTTPSDTNTTYTVASGDNNGQIKITPSSGDAYNVSVKGLGSAAYTNSSAYATSGHTHTLNIAASSGTSQISLSPNTKYQLTAGGSTYIFTTPPATTMTYSISTGDNNGQIKVTPSSGDAYNVSVKGLGSAAYTNSSAYAAASHTHSQYLPLAGGTMTGAITLALDKYNVDEYGLDCNNSNIIGVNNIKFKDDPDEDASEGIHFYRTDSTWDSLWGRNGALYFTPNHPTGTTNYTIYHSGNLTYSTIGAAAANHTHSNYLGAKSANGFYGMASPSTDDTVWIRTTSLGLIPYQSGAAGSGHQSLGTSSWYFSAAYIDNIYGTLNGRAVYADNSYVLVTDPSSKGTYGIVFVADPSITEDNTLRKSNSIKINHFVGAANTEGITELILGNSVAKSSAGNSSGHLTLYNSNGKWAEIYPNASATADYNLYLPASTGTLALVGDNNHTHNYIPNTDVGLSAAINLLSVGDSDPVDDDYYVSQIAGGGTTSTSYHRRPVSKLWNYIKGKITSSTSGSGNAVTAVSYSGGVITVTKGSTFSVSTHTHGLLNSNLFVNAPNETTNTWAVIGANGIGHVLKSIRTQANAAPYLLGNYSAGIVFGGADTRGVISHSYGSPSVRFAGGNKTATDGGTAVWYFTVNATSGQTYTLPSTGGTLALSSHTHSSITGSNKHDAAVPTSTVGNGVLTLFYNVDNSSGNMPKTNNANAILQINKHSGEYDSQLGFSSDGNIYYRSALGSEFTTSSPWKQLAWKDDRLGANSDGSYWGMTSPSNDASVWIRTTSLGIIPYQSGGAGSGHCALGTSSWYFNYAYIDTVYGSLSGRASEASNCVCTYFSTDSYTTNTSYGMLFVADPTITEVNSLRKTDDIRVNYFLGAANTEGLVELVLGNATAKSSANNASGHLTFYNANGKYAEIFPGSNSAHINLTLPSSTGTLALVGDNNHTHSYIPLSGSTAITGELVTTSANGYRLVYNKYGAIIRNDGESWWFLITSQQSSDAAAKTASWANTNTLVNNSHPLRIQLSNGRVYINGYTIDKSVPSNAKFTDTNTTYTIGAGDNNGQIKVTPSSGSAYNVSVKGLGSAAYTASTAYAAASHTHSYAGSTTVGGDALSSLSLRLTHDNEVNCSKVSPSYSNIWFFYRWSDGSTEDATGSKYIDSIWFGNGNGAGNNTSVGKFANLVFNNINQGTLRHGGSASSWWNDRNAAMVYQTDKTTSYLPIWGCRTNSDGSWCCGNHNGDNLYFNFIPKSVYDSGANPSYYRQIYFTSDAKIEARGYNIINNGSGRLIMDYSGIAMYNSRSGGWADGIDMFNSQNTLVSSIGFYGVDNALQYTYIGGSYAIPLLKIEPSTAVTTIYGTEPYLYIVSSNHTNSGIVLQRGSSSDTYTDYRIINLGRDFKIQSNVESDVNTDWFDMMTIAYSTGDTTVKGHLRSGGDIIMPEGYSIKLRPNHSGYYAGIGYDTVGNECIAMWAKNTVTRLRWHAGIDMSSSTYNQMISLTNPDFEISKASGTALGYIGGRQIVRSQVLFSGSTTITSGKEKTTITLTDTVSPFGFVAIRFYYSGNPAGYCETIVSSYNNNWMSGVFAVNPGGGAPGTYNACKTIGVYVNNSAQMSFNCDANLIIYNITGYCEG